MTTAVAAPPLPDAPYRGIEPFRFTDQQIFAARTEETWTLLSNVTLYRAVLLYGESGTGKSSLVNAGLLPQALKENYVPDRLRVQPIAGREIKVERIRISNVQDEPVYLPSNFGRTAARGSTESLELSLEDFRARLEEFRINADEENAGELLLAARSTPRPLLIFDQFEEFITLFEEAQRVGTPEETRLAIAQVPAAQQEILATLVDLIQDDTLPVKLIFSFREDYLAKLSILFDRCPELLDQSQRLLPPGIDALAQIIRAPFIDPSLRAHFLQQKGEGSELSETLARKIAHELGRRSKGDTANLTELQIVCQRLWQASDPEKMFEQDGIEGLLKGYGGDVFRNFTPEMQNAAVVLLSHMITSSNTRNIVSEEDLLTRTSECDFNALECTDALAALSRSQIVRREPRHSIYFYEITSEYLVPWIKEQVAKRQTAEERRLADETQKRLREEKTQAMAKFEAAQRRSRLLRRLLTAVILLLAVTFLLGSFAFRQYQKVAKAENDTKLAKQQTEQILNALKLVTSQDKDEILQGISQVDTLIKENKIPADLASAVIQPTLSSRNKEVHQAGYELVLRAEQTNPNVAQSLVKAAETNTTLAEKIPPRFAIHISDESQRPQARQIASVLKKQGYLVTGIQNVGDKGVRSNQLRYFRESEPGIPTPQEILAVLNKSNVGEWNIRRIPGFENSKKIVTGQFEIWFASIPLEQVLVYSGDGKLYVSFFANGVLFRGDASGKIVIKDSAGRTVITKPFVRELNLNLKVDTYTLFVEVFGYLPETKQVTVKPEETTSVTVKLTRADTRQQLTAPRAR